MCAFIFPCVCCNLLLRGFPLIGRLRVCHHAPQIERFLLRERCTAWLRELVADKESWAGLCQPGSVVNSLLQSLFLKALEAKDEAGRKRKRADDGE